MQQTKKKHLRSLKLGVLIKKTSAQKPKQTTNQAKIATTEEKITTIPQNKTLATLQMLLRSIK